MEEKILIFGKKNSFHKRKHLIHIDKLHIDRIMLSNKDLYGKKKVHLKTLLGIKPVKVLNHYS